MTLICSECEESIKVNSKWGFIRKTPVIQTPNRRIIELGIGGRIKGIESYSICGNHYYKIIPGSYRHSLTETPVTQDIIYLFLAGHGVADAFLGENVQFLSPHNIGISSDSYWADDYAVKEYLPITYRRLCDVKLVDTHPEKIAKFKFYDFEKIKK
jgi:hypothetical protein